VVLTEIQQELARLIEQSRLQYPQYFTTGSTTLSGEKQVLLAQAQTQAYQQFANDPALLDFARTTNYNLIALGQSSIDASQAIREQTAILAAQQARINSLATTPTKTPIDLSKTGEPGVKEKLSDIINSVKDTIGTTGLLVLGGIIIVSLVKSK